MHGSFSASVKFNHDKFIFFFVQEVCKDLGRKWGRVENKLLFQLMSFGVFQSILPDNRIVPYISHQGHSMYVEAYI